MDAERFDVIIIGTGSGNMIPDELAQRRVAIVERDVFGGTCLNRGCIPSKMFVYAADRAHEASDSSAYGLRTSFDGADWPAIVDRVFGRIDPIASGGEKYRGESDTITVVRGSARFVGHKTLDVDGRRITAETIIVAAGARPYVPLIEGLDDVDYHTSDTIMRLESLPERLIVVGGGYIAAELGHVFGALGSQVTVINRSDRLLRNEDDDVSLRFTELLSKRFDVRCGTTVQRVRTTAAGSIQLDLSTDGSTHTLEGDALLMATGRVPNADELDVTASGIEVTTDGRVATGADLATSVEGIYALGDIASAYQLKHVANAEARIAFHNVLHPDNQRTMSYEAVPHAVFASPQVASVGMTEQQVAATGVPYVAATKDYAATAYGWAMEDTASFAKLIAHAETRQLLGAHIIGAQAPTLLQGLVGAMRFGIDVDRLAHEQLWIHPALTEVVENALLDL